MVNQSEIIAYATDVAEFAVFKYAQNFPDETKEDLKQISLLRVLEVIDSVDTSKPWKSFIQLHAKGAVLDYLKSKKNHIFHYDESEYGEMVIADSLLEYGIFYNSSDEIKLKINWDLVSRMASKDDLVFLVARFILGYTITDISRNSKLSRESINQKFVAFIEKLDDPFNISDAWTNQVIFAFGLSEYFNQKAIDNGEGWDLEPIDIFSSDIEFRKKKYTNQLNLI